MTKTLLHRFSLLDSNENGYLNQVEFKQLLCDLNIEIDEKLQDIVFDILKIDRHQVSFLALSQLIYTAQNADLTDPLHIVFMTLDYKQTSLMPVSFACTYFKSLFTGETRKLVEQSVLQEVLKDKEFIDFNVFRQIFKLFQ